MHVPHPFGIAALVLTTASGLGLLRFTGKPKSQLTPEQLSSVLPGMPLSVRRHYAIEIWGYYLSFVALALGVIFQLLDLLKS